SMNLINKNLTRILRAQTLAWVILKQNQETGNAESPLKDKLVPETIPETETVVEDRDVNGYPWRRIV
ncbi:hypothetical protein A2U01_0060411, partial [Trifolium medium]|nr:hypothetical protein [Trifolium medium]